MFVLSVIQSEAAMLRQQSSKKFDAAYFVFHY